MPCMVQGAALRKPRRACHTGAGIQLNGKSSCRRRGGACAPRMMPASACWWSWGRPRKEKRNWSPTATGCLSRPSPGSRSCAGSEPTGWQSAPAGGARRGSRVLRRARVGRSGQPCAALLGAQDGERAQRRFSVVAVSDRRLPSYLVAKDHLLKRLPEPWNDKLSQQLDAKPVIEGEFCALKREVLFSVDVRFAAMLSPKLQCSVISRPSRESALDQALCGYGPQVDEGAV